MIKSFTTRLSDSSFPILVLSYSILMMHYVFSRAFRDSLLGSRLSVSELPGLTFLGTLLAITLSLICSLFLRSDARIHVIRFFYVLNAVAEIIIAFQYQTHSWMLRAYYIEVSASTAIGLSLIWVLIGDWTSNCNHGNTNKVPSVLISGTAAGMFAGFGLVYLPSSSDLRASLVMLAVMDVCVSSLLLVHRDGSCIPAGKKKFEELSQVRRNWTSAVVRMLTIVTILGASASTLLDLVFRVRVAEHYTSQAQRIHFMGSLQGFLCLGALLSQFVVRRLTSGPWAKRCLTLYPGILTAAALASVAMPVFQVFGFLRIGEYSLRNSASRCGIEMVYAALPDRLRVEVRPLVDVVGERLGDMSSAGILHFLLTGTTRVNFKYTLLVVASLGTALWICSEWLLRRVDRMKAAADTDNEIQLPLQKLAREGAVLA
jgi:ATP/ADP translocase